MTFSPLTTRTVPHHNKFSDRAGSPVLRVIQHHWAGVTGGDVSLMNPDRQASSNYIIYSDGEIVGQVPEEFRAWTSGSAEADRPSITIEAQNSTGAPEWEVSDQAVEAIIALTADIADRYKWGAVAEPNYRGHREFKATACPGPWLWALRPVIIDKANSLLGQKVSYPVPVVPPQTPPAKPFKSDWLLADEVLAGMHGSGDARKRSLGARYDAVQAVVNRRLGATGKQPSAKSIGELADEVLAGVHGSGDQRRKSLGDRYNAVQAEVNRRLGGGARQPTGPNIAELANAVLRGEYGNGPERKRRLGSLYELVQVEVNRRLR